MTSFSHRMGIKPVKSVIQLDSMDRDLRVGLWNALFFSYSLGNAGGWLKEHAGVYELMHAVWRDHFKRPLDLLPDYGELAVEEVKTHFFGCQWNEVYDFLEFVAKHHWQGPPAAPALFLHMCNEAMEREVSGYRLIGGEVAQIIAEEEIAEVERALESSDNFRPVAVHLASALTMLADRREPDYRNSIKESISAVESMCQLITGTKSSGLDGALKEIEKSYPLHGALRSAFRSLYGYTSDEGGIRHALIEESDLRFEDAKFMLVVCSAFVNYLRAKF